MFEEAPVLLNALFAIITDEEFLVVDDKGETHKFFLQEAELLDQLAPPSVRGPETSRWLKNSYMAGGVLHLEKDYENILVVTDGSTDSGDEILTIRWKKRTCAAPKSAALVTNTRQP